MRCPRLGLPHTALGTARLSVTVTGELGREEKEGEAGLVVDQVKLWREDEASSEAARRGKTFLTRLRPTRVAAKLIVYTRRCDGPSRGPGASQELFL